MSFLEWKSQTMKIICHLCYNCTVCWMFTMVANYFEFREGIGLDICTQCCSRSCQNERYLEIPILNMFWKEIYNNFSENRCYTHWSQKWARRPKLLDWEISRLGFMQNAFVIFTFEVSKKCVSESTSRCEAVKAWILSLLYTLKHEFVLRRVEI